MTVVVVGVAVVVVLGGGVCGSMVAAVVVEVAFAGACGFSLFCSGARSNPTVWLLRLALVPDVTDVGRKRGAGVARGKRTAASPLEERRSLGFSFVAMPVRAWALTGQATSDYTAHRPISY